MRSPSCSTSNHASIFTQPFEPNDFQILIKWSKWWVGFGIAMWALSNKLFFPHFYTWYFKLDESSKFRMLSWDSCCVVHCLHEETEDLMSFAHFVAFQQDATHENSSNHFNTTTIPKVKCSLLETSIVATSSHVISLDHYFRGSRGITITHCIPLHLHVHRATWIANRNIEEGTIFCCNNIVAHLLLSKFF